MLIKQSPPLQGTVEVNGAKNAVLVIMTSLILTNGTSTLNNVPNNADVRLMISLLQLLGAHVTFNAEKKQLIVNTEPIGSYEIPPEIMNKIRASILVAGPLLARFGRARVAYPGGDLIGLRPINYHLEGFKKCGATILHNDPFVEATITSQKNSYNRIVLEYPSVGATENLLMFASLGTSETVIINAALEPEVLDLIDVLKKMGASIEILPVATIVIKGASKLNPVTHSIIPDRLEAGALLAAAAITGGHITISNARASDMDIFLEKLSMMGHAIQTPFTLGANTPDLGITIKATTNPIAVGVKTAPYPGFPTDLQPSFMALLCAATGTSVIEETVYENRMVHARELRKMGAQIAVDGAKATIHGVEELYGTDVIATDIRASCSLMLAGLIAQGQTRMTGLHHWQRGYDQLEEKLRALGANITIEEHSDQMINNAL